MDESLTARPELLKQANLSLIRKVITDMGTATRAEIVRETEISSTTVRSLLAEMLQNGEIVSIGYDASSGGRKAERYKFVPNRYHGVACCIIEDQVHGLIVNSCGEIVEASCLEVPGSDFEVAIVSYLDTLVQEREIRSIGIGVPGVVDGESYWRKVAPKSELCKITLGDTLAKRYGIPVILENDLKATAIGFSRRYEKEFPTEMTKHINMVYLHFEQGCISAGMIAEDVVLHGHSNFTGELGLIPMGRGMLLDDYISGDIDDTEYTRLVVHVLGWICGILNPKYIVLGGRALRTCCIEGIKAEFSHKLPSIMAADILYSPDVWQDYHEGMAFLTSKKMFDLIRFRKE